MEDLEDPSLSPALLASSTSVNRHFHGSWKDVMANIEEAHDRHRSTFEPAAVSKEASRKSSVTGVESYI